MPLNFLGWLTGKPSGQCKEVTVEELHAMAADLNIRILAWNVCVNMIANAIGKCEFKTLVAGKEVKDAEYYLLNVEPNINQNSTMFWHEFIHKLASRNEALAIAPKHRDGHEMLVVADDWENPAKYPAKMNVYRSVRVGEVTYSKTYFENEVLHLRLNHANIKPVLDSLYGSYSKLISAAQQYYRKRKGTRLKVKVSQVADGDDNYASAFKKLMDEQVKPWINSDSGVLPEFEGYEYSDMNREYASEDSRDIRAMVDDIFTFTARGLNIPPVLVTGNVAGTEDAVTNWLTLCIDPLCDQIQEELNRKRYGFERWRNGDRVHIDTSTIMHFDMFANAGNIEKLIGSGAFAINDVLAAAGLPEIDEPWANKHWLTKNFADIRDAASAAENGGKGGNVNG